MTRKRTVVLGFVGSVLDAGDGPKRWERWRPTVSLCQHEDLIVDHFELFTQREFARLGANLETDIKHVSPETTVRRQDLSIRDPWSLEEVYGALHDFARAYPFRPDVEDYLIHITTGTHISQICMFLLAESRHIPAKLLQTSPGRKDVAGTYTIIDLDLSKYDRLASRFNKAHNEALSFLKSGIETKNVAFNRLIERIEQVAIASREPILLMGATGSGKSHLAKRVFELKKARQRVVGEFVEVNCATLRGDAAMSTLFGHAKGAYTGAVETRAGLLKKAHMGVLFLDEIGELGTDEQAMLLRAIEERAFYPVGSDKEVQSDFQLIVGTNRDLANSVIDGRFRDDLLARINTWTFRLPTLSERREDIEPNLEYELDRVSTALSLRITFSRDARDRFLHFAQSKSALWRGNFRDFSSSIKRLATLAHNGRIGSDDVDEEIQRLLAAWQPSATKTSLVSILLGPQGTGAIDRFDRVQLEDVLSVCKGARSLSEAGRRLFEVSLTKKAATNDSDRLRKYLRRFDIEWKDIVGQG